MDLVVTNFGTVPFDFIRRGISFEQRSVKVFGKLHPQPRLTRWYGPVAYEYSGLSWLAEAMPEYISGLCSRVSRQVGVEFNSVLCNLYRDGRDAVGWHSDDEAIFGADPVVASLSFGASRLFKVRSNLSGEVHSYDLYDGSLLVMPAGFQRGWQHTIPRTRRVCGQRVNLTFRRVV